MSKTELVLATVASHEPGGYREKRQRSFGGPGISQVIELYISRNGTRRRVKEKLAGLRDVSAVFFSGGDRPRITSLDWRHAH
ncbi:hypothetical protein ACEQ6A_15525 [Rhizobium brockwellii]|uniref:hypothetical protein n=1 Tax=Rhizobium brockwellii TaxID=3019932 RepID=UPI003F9CC201